MTVPFAHLHRPDVTDDVTVPVQKYFKDERFVSRTPRKGVVLVRPNPHHLKQHFREQLETTWQVRASLEERTVCTDFLSMLRCLAVGRTVAGLRASASAQATPQGLLALAHQLLVAVPLHQVR